MTNKLQFKSTKPSRSFHFSKILKWRKTQKSFPDPNILSIIVCFCYFSTAFAAEDFSNFDSSFNEINDYSTIKAKTPTYQIEIHPKPAAKYFICPSPHEVSEHFFTLPCDNTKDCSILGPDLLCCNSKCLKGKYSSKPEPSHAPAFFGLVERTCPLEPIAEVFPIKECKTDSDCSPRICCPENQAENEVPVSYCRTGAPKFENFPAKQFIKPIKNFISYMQCTPPPPPFLDLFPKPCRTQFDCFPNLCCQENGKRFCRPPKRSILALIAGIGQRFGQSEATKRFISRITT